MYVRRREANKARKVNLKNFEYFQPQKKYIHTHVYMLYIHIYNLFMPLRVLGRYFIVDNALNNCRLCKFLYVHMCIRLFGEQKMQLDEYIQLYVCMYITAYVPRNNNSFEAI